MSRTLLTSNTIPQKSALQLHLLIEGQHISQRVAAIARTLEDRYANQELLVLTPIQDTFMLVADLMRVLHLPTQLTAFSYQKNTVGTPHPTVTCLGDVEMAAIQGAHVLVVDTLFDTGEALSQAVTTFRQLQPASLASLVLVSKDVARGSEYYPDYTLFEIGDRFLVGYGLSYQGLYRGLPDIYAIER